MVKIWPILNLQFLKNIENIKDIGNIDTHSPSFTLALPKTWAALQKISNGAKSLQWSHSLSETVVPEMENMDGTRTSLLKNTKKNYIVCHLLHWGLCVILSQGLPSHLHNRSIYAV